MAAAGEKMWMLMLRGQFMWCLTSFFVVKIGADSQWNKLEVL